MIVSWTSALFIMTHTHIKSLVAFIYHEVYVPMRAAKFEVPLSNYLLLAMMLSEVGRSGSDKVRIMKYTLTLLVWLTGTIFCTPYTYILSLVQVISWNILV